MVYLIGMKVDAAMNRNSTMSVTIYDPSALQETKLAEGKDIFVPLFEGIVFSGTITHISKKQLTPDNVEAHKYAWEIEAVSDEYKLKNEIIPKESADVYMTKTPGELLDEYLGEDWIGEIYREGPPFEFSSLPIDKGSVVNDLVSQTGYDVRTRREYGRYRAEVYQQHETQYYDALSTSDEIFPEGSLVGHYLLFVDGEGAFRSGGKIAVNRVSSGGNYSYIYGTFENDTLPSDGDHFIIVKNPVLDFKPVMGEGASVKTLIINKTLLDFGAIDDKSSRYTKVVCTGRSYQGKAISSTLSAVYDEWGGTTTTSYRGDGVLHREARNGDTSIVVKGHQFLAATGEKVYFIAPGVYDELIVNYTERITDYNGYQVTNVVLGSGSSVNGNYAVGTPVMFDGEGSKIYVEDHSNLNNVVAIGEECIIYSAKGHDEHGDYLLNCHRGQYQEGGYSRAYDHPVGTLVRNITHTEDNPHPNSPYAKHGCLVKVVNSSATCSRGDLDRLCSTLLPRGSNITNSGEGLVPLNHFWKIDEYGGYVPLQVGDTVTVQQGGTPLGDYVLLSYSIDFDRVMVKIRLGDYDEHIIFKLKDVYDTVTRQIS